MSTIEHRAGRPRLTQLLSVGVLLAVSHASMGCSAPPFRTSPHAPTSRYTLVRRGAWLRERPDAAAPAARDPFFADKPYQLGRAMSMEVVRREGGWVAVRPVLRTAKSTDTGRSRRPCVSTPYAMRRIDIVVWVRVADLVPAVRRETQYRYRDDTAITLRVGVPVKLKKRLASPRFGMYDVRPGRFRFNTVLPNDAVGLFWRAGPTQGLAYDNVPSHERLTKKAEMTFGQTARVLDTRRWSTLFVQNRRTTPAGELVEVRGRCAVLQVLVAPEQVIGHDPRTGGLGLLGGAGGIGGDKPAMTVPAETPLTWRDGEPAGTTLDALQPTREVPVADDLRRCFRWSLRTYWSKKFRARRAESEWVLCAPRGQVR